MLVWLLGVMYCNKANCIYIYQNKEMGVLSILRNEVEINRCVTVRQHVLWITNGWMFPLRYTWQLLVGNVFNAQRHHWWITEGVSYTLPCEYGIHRG